MTLAKFISKFHFYNNSYNNGIIKFVVVYRKRKPNSTKPNNKQIEIQTQTTE